jgi:hypothetical protein
MNSPPWELSAGDTWLHFPISLQYRTMPEDSPSWNLIVMLTVSVVSRLMTVRVHTPEFPYKFTFVNNLETVLLISIDPVESRPPCV